MKRYHLQDSIVGITLYEDKVDHFGRHFVHQDDPCFIINNCHTY